MTRSECEKFSGRLKEICEGAANLPLDRINAYRQKWELIPLLESERPIVYKESPRSAARSAARSAVPKLTGNGPGSVLIYEYTQKGVPHCQACYDLAIKMDMWGPDECENRTNEIVSDMIPRAKEWLKTNRPWIHALLPDAVEEVGISRKLRSDIKEAISRSRELISSNSVIPGFASLMPSRKSASVSKNGKQTVRTSTSGESGCRGCGNSKKEPDFWSYGIMAVNSRSRSHLPVTVQSIKNAGFDAPIIFMDDGCSFDSSEYTRQGYEVVKRSARIGAFANWTLAVWELYLRNPKARRYLLFQDDVICCKNLREYLESVEYTSNSWYNLYTWKCNVKRDVKGWYPSPQWGRGALALMFDNTTLKVLLSSSIFMEHRNSSIGHKGVDRAVVNALRGQGYREHVHNPSLVQHTGLTSTINNAPNLTSPTFQGEEFDALQLLKNPDSSER